MPIIQYKNHSYDCAPEETVLQAFLRHGIDIPFSCKNGICHVCLMRAIDHQGSLPEKAQKGLKQRLIDKQYFKACCCQPQSDMQVEAPRPADMLTHGVIAKKQMLSDDVCRFLIEPATDIYYHPGQFINLQREDGEMRSYSLCSVPREDYFLEIHVKRVENGLFSHWMFNVLNEGDEIEFQGPNGDNFYKTSDVPKQNLLLIATGTGLSPLSGIVRDALLSDHQGDIYLYHGSHDQQGLYLHEKMLQLAKKYPQFHYIPCVSGEDISGSLFCFGRANEVAFSEHKDLQHWQVYLCGQPNMVEQAMEQANNLGAEKENVFSDPFWPVMDKENKHEDAQFTTRERRHYPEPNPQMWLDLKEGKTLTLILNDFYTQVYADPKLSSFFEGTTKQRSIEKQYSFLYQVLTGENVYFGDRPRNAHHWMVISDELFDYRANIMENCIRAQGLPEDFIQRWMSMENEYRVEIVKDKPWNRFKFGKEIPMDGFEELKMDMATLCDNCQAEIDVGDVVRYHVRIGKVYCKECMKPS